MASGARRGGQDLAEVLLDADAVEDEVREIEKIFDEAGVPAIVDAAIVRASRDLLPWIMVVKIPLTAFLASLGARAAEDAWNALKALVLLIYEARRRPDRRDGVIRLEDPERMVILTDDISDEGYRQLASGELPPGGYYVWDTQRGGWRNELPAWHHVWAPVGGDDDEVGLRARRADPVEERSERRVRRVERNVLDARAPRARRPARLVVGEAEHRQAQASEREEPRSRCLGEIRSRSDMGDASAVERRERLDRTIHRRFQLVTPNVRRISPRGRRDGNRPPTGAVFVHGEIWRAHTDGEPIPVGETVRVDAIGEALLLEVSRVEEAVAVTA